MSDWLVTIKWMNVKNDCFATKIQTPDQFKNINKYQENSKSGIRLKDSVGVMSIN